MPLVETIIAFSPRIRYNRDTNISVGCMVLRSALHGCGMALVPRTGK